MVLLKISSLLAVLGLLGCQMYSSQAAPARRALEPLPDRVTEAHRLLRALIRELTADDMEANDGSSLDRPMSKRCSGLSTCTLLKLSQDLQKLNSYPLTDVGAGTPGKKRSALAAMDNEHYANYGEQFDVNNSSGAANKRSCNTSTCATQRLIDLLNRTGGVANGDYVPTDVSADSYGRRRRNLHV